MMYIHCITQIDGKLQWKFLCVCRNENVSMTGLHFNEILLCFINAASWGFVAKLEYPFTTSQKQYSGDSIINSRLEENAKTAWY